MAVLITNDDALDQLIDDAEIERIAAFVLAEEGIARPAEVSVSFVGDEEMRELNRMWRGIDRPTDVLSFECDDPAGSDVPEGEPLELGDVIIDPVQIERQAPEFGSDVKDECRLMLVHGLLHLLGYDHIEDGEAEIMEAREDELLRALARERGDDPERLRGVITTRHTDD